MDRAYLGADYHDAGANRVVSVLEEIREGLHNKLRQAMIVDYDVSLPVADRMKSVGHAEAFRTVIDDIALFIQREQRRD